MKNTIITAIACGLICCATPAAAQGQKTLAQKLGYPADAKLLIVHADDIGVSRSQNVASERALQAGAVTSGSVMVPCPWFPDFAAYYREHPGLDVGIHITLTAEWDYYKWGGVSPAGDIPSLLDEDGHFYPTAEAVAQHAVAAEVETEVRAQIQRAMALGIRPTHLDTHMGTMLASPQIVPIYLKLGKEYGLPLLLPRFWLQSVPADQRDALAAQYVLLDGLYMIGARDSTKSWPQQYADLIASMGPGLNEMIVHLALDDTEMQAVTVNHPDFGSAWRQRDLDFVTSAAFKDLLKARDIKLVTWGQIRDAVRQP
jgi:predicted glycoside hydrolase/deacetylase ChbG (UPF0249 family)